MPIWHNEKKRSQIKIRTFLAVIHRRLVLCKPEGPGTSSNANNDLAQRTDISSVDIHLGHRESLKGASNSDITSMEF